MKPKLSYTIWFSQRTGSTLLCKALEATGLAGNPQEWLYVWLTDQQWEHPAELQLRLWEGGSTANGVFGLKHSFHEPAFRRLIDLFQMFPGSLQHESNRACGLGTCTSKPQAYFHDAPEQGPAGCVVVASHSDAGMAQTCRRTSNNQRE